MAMRWQSSRPSVAAERGGAAPGGRCVCVCVGVWVGAGAAPAAPAGGGTGGRWHRRAVALAAPARTSAPPHGGAAHGGAEQGGAGRGGAMIV